MKVLERSQQISHCKSMWIFYDAQGKLTPHSEAGSSLNSNSSKLLSLTLLPARMKKIQSKVKAQEWSQLCYIIHQFLRCSRSANSLIGDGILTKFKLIRAFIVVLLICKNEYGLFKFESTRVVTTFLPLSVYGDFLRGSRAANPKVQGLIWPNFKPIQAFKVDLFTCKNEEDPIKNEGARVVTTISINF